MRLILIGQQAFGKACLESIIKNDVDDVVTVYCAQDIEGKPFDPVKEYALDQRIPVVQPPNFKDGAVLHSMKALNSDLCVMAFVTIFVPQEATVSQKMFLYITGLIKSVETFKARMPGWIYRIYYDILYNVYLTVNSSDCSIFLNVFSFL